MNTLLSFCLLLSVVASLGSFLELSYATGWPFCYGVYTYREWLEGAPRKLIQPRGRGENYPRVDLGRAVLLHNEMACYLDAISQKRSSVNAVNIRSFDQRKSRGELRPAPPDLEAHSTEPS
jgi:hypothetical protein